MSVWELAAFAGGFVGLGVGVGLAVYHLNLAWFLAHVWKPEGTRREAERAIGLLERDRDRRRLRERLKARVGRRRGRHLAGRPVEVAVEVELQPAEREARKL